MSAGRLFAHVGVVVPFGKKLLELIKASRYRNQRQFALAIGMEATYLNRIIKGMVKRPTPEMLRRMADALPHDYDDLMILAGYPPTSRASEESAVAVLAPPEVDRAFDVAQIVAFVEAKPDPEFQAKLARQKARRTPESYARLCVRIYRAWTSNADLVINELEEVGI